MLLIKQMLWVYICYRFVDTFLYNVICLERKQQDQAIDILAHQSRLREENDKFNMLESRFFELASNHEEMIRIKDEYKASNEKLRTENIQLRRDNEKLFSKRLNELTEECESLRQFNSSIVVEVKKLEEKNFKLEEMLKEVKESKESEINELNSKYGEKIKILEEESKVAKGKLKAITGDYENIKLKAADLEKNFAEEKAKLAKEKDELLSLVMERGRIIQDKQTENKALATQSAELQKQINASRQRFKDEMDRVDCKFEKNVRLLSS